MIKDRSKIAHIFVLETLEESISPDRIEVKPMFGAHSIYVDEKIICTLRHRPRSPQDNGIWLVMSENYFEELKKVFPSMRYIDIFKHVGGKGFKSWVNIPEDGDDFQSEAMRLCEMIIKGDPRLGKLPLSKLRTEKTRAVRGKKVKKVSKKKVAAKKPKSRKS